MNHKITWIISIIIIFLFGCKPTQYIPIEHQTVITYKDSTIYHNDTIHVQLEKEAYNYYSSLLDTLYMETQYAYSTAFIDTTNKLLNGTISNKHIDIPVIYQWKDRYITTDSIVYQDRPIYIPDQRAEKKLSIYKTMVQALALLVIILCVPIIIRLIKKFK